MKSRVILLFVALVSTTAVIVWLRRVGPDVPSPAQSKQMEYDLDASEPQSQQPAPRSGLTNPLQVVKPPTNNPTETTDADTDLLFDASGHLVKNVRLRDEIERLLSSDPGDLEQSKQDLVASLPPAAAQQMLEMVDRFVNYRAALRQALPESPQAMSEQDALTMLETVHALRVTYFGPELTEVLFGAEEALGRGSSTSGGETR
jgi:hypothetical protein